MLLLQEAAHPGDASNDWPQKFGHLLQGIKGSSAQRDAEKFLLGMLHPDPAQRPTAAEALQHSFMS